MAQTSGVELFSRISWFAIAIAGGISAGCAKCPDAQEYDEDLQICKLKSGDDQTDADLQGKLLYEWDGGDGGFSPSVVYYPAGDVTNPGTTKVAVAFQALATDGTQGSSIHLIRLEVSENGSVSPEPIDEIVRQSSGIIGAHLSMGYLPVSKKLVIAYFDETDGKLYLAWEQGINDWSITQVDGQDYPTGAFVDLAVDPYSDTVHLAYVDEGLHDLRYSMVQDGTVILGGVGASGLIDTGLVELGTGVISGGLIDKKVSVTVSPLGDPTISYYEESSGQLRIAQYDSGSDVWIKRVLGTATSTLVQPDSDGRVVVDDEFVPWPDQLKVFKDGLEVTSPVRVISATQIEIPDYDAASEYELQYVVVPSANYGVWNDLATDESGTIYLCYYDFQKQSLSLATTAEPIAADQWQIQTVDSSGNVGNRCVTGIRTLATESQIAYQPIVAYFDGSTADIRAAYRRRGNWTSGDVDSPGWTGLELGMDVGSDGYVVVAYSVMDFDTQAFALRVYRCLPESLE